MPPEWALFRKTWKHSTSIDFLIQKISSKIVHDGSHPKEIKIENP